MQDIRIKDIDSYLALAPAHLRPLLEKLRQTIGKAAPKAEELISYGIAGYKYHGMLIYFAGFSNHISVYPAPRGVDAFKKELAIYKGGKGTIQFPLDKPVPLDLVKRIIIFRMKENEAKAVAKKLNK